MAKIEDYEQLTCLGVIAGAYGMQGEVKVSPLTDTPEYYLNINRFFVETSLALLPFSTKSIKLHKGYWIIQFEKVTSRDQTAEIKGCRIFLEDSRLRPLEEGQFFLHQLIGCRVVDMENRDLGEITDIMETGANDVYVVENETHEFLVPVVPHVVKEINIPQNFVRIDPIPGLIYDE